MLKSSRTLLLIKYLKEILSLLSVNIIYMDKYDLCIIGAGPSGYAAAMRAVDFEKKQSLLKKIK